MAAAGDDLLLIERDGVLYRVTVAEVAALAGGVSQAAFDALLAEVVAARGARSALDLRISTISNFASPNAGGYVVGRFYDTSFHAGNSTTLTGAAGRVEMVPFYSSQSLRIDQLGVSVSTAGAGVTGRCFIYAADASGWPDDLIFEAPDTIDLSAAGFVAHTVDIELDSGRQYWLGLRRSGSAAVRAIAGTSAANLGLSGSAATTSFTMIRRTIAFGTPLPSVWTLGSLDPVTGNPPSIRFRIAP